jgi:anti-anti-sigma factor
VELELQVVARHKVVVIRCRGRLRYGPEANELVLAVRHALETSREIVPQMADVTQIDSGGVGALGTAFVAAHNRDAKLKLAALHPRVAEVLRITNLEMLFDVHASESEAVAAFFPKALSPEIVLDEADKINSQ